MEFFQYEELNAYARLRLIQERLLKLEEDHFTLGLADVETANPSRHNNAKVAIKSIENKVDILRAMKKKILSELPVDTNGTFIRDITGQ